METTKSRTVKLKGENIEMPVMEETQEQTKVSEVNAEVEAINLSTPEKPKRKYSPRKKAESAKTVRSVRKKSAKQVMPMGETMFVTHEFELGMKRERAETIAEMFRRIGMTAKVERLGMQLQISIEVAKDIQPSQLINIGRFIGQNI